MTVCSHHLNPWEYKIKLEDTCILQGHPKFSPKNDCCLINVKDMYADHPNS